MQRSILCLSEVITGGPIKGHGVFAALILPPIELKMFNDSLIFINNNSNDNNNTNLSIMVLSTASSYYYLLVTTLIVRVPFAAITASRVTFTNNAVRYLY